MQFVQLYLLWNLFIERVCVCVWERERVCVCVCACVCRNAYMHACVCACMYASCCFCLRLVLNYDWMSVQASNATFHWFSHLHYACFMHYCHVIFNIYLLYFLVNLCLSWSVASIWLPFHVFSFFSSFFQVVLCWTATGTWLRFVSFQRSCCLLSPIFTSMTWPIVMSNCKLHLNIQICVHRCSVACKERKQNIALAAFDWC